MQIMVDPFPSRPFNGKMLFEFGFCFWPPKNNAGGENEQKDQRTDTGYQLARIPHQQPTMQGKYCG